MVFRMIYVPIIWIHFDLIVPWKAIRKGHSFEATCVVNHDVIDGQRKLIHRIGCIKITKVNVDFDLFVIFNTGIMLSTQSGCCSSRTKPHSMILWTSISIASKLSGQNHHCCSLIGLVSGLMLRWCIATCGSRSGMCSYLHSKTSIHSRIRDIRFCLSYGDRL